MSWTWNKRNDDNWSHDLFDTKEDAIDDAKNYNYADFYVGEAEIIPLRTDVDSDRIMEELNELYHDESGCDTYIYDGVSDEDKKWLEEKLSELMHEFHERAKINPGWYRVSSEEHIVL